MINDKKKRSRLFHDISTRIVKLINVIMMTAPFIIAWYMFYADLLWVHFFMRGHWLVIGLFMMMYIILGRINNAFKISYSRKGEMVYSQFLSCIEADAILYIVAWLLIRHLPNALPMLGVLAVQIIIAIIWSYCAQAWYYRVFPAEKTIVIYDHKRNIAELIKRYHLERKYDVKATIDVIECISDLSVLDEADTIFMVGIHSHERDILAKHCLKNRIKIFMIPRVGDLIVSSAKRNSMLYLPILKIDGANLSLEYLFIKRLIDIVLSIIGLILTLPITIATAICIKLEDKGPIIYRQTRLTKDGREFEILKFRSMIVNAEEDGIARLSTGINDDRTTKVGRVIRKYRIDELPQLINILKGDLSIVGPRAERPELVSQYEELIPEFALRLQIKAGLTGYAQVLGKYNTEPYDKLLMDLMYIANASVFEDIRIIIGTVKILFMSESTEGVDSTDENTIYCNGGKRSY